MASFNVENMFDRPKPMSRDGASQAPAVLAAHARVNQLTALDVYDDPTNAEIVEQLKVLGLRRSDANTYAALRKIRGWFLTHRRSGETLVAAAGRMSWGGGADHGADQ